MIGLRSKENCGANEISKTCIEFGIADIIREIYCHSVAVVYWTQLERSVIGLARANRSAAFNYIYHVNIRITYDKKARQ